MRIVIASVLALALLGCSKKDSSTSTGSATTTTTTGSGSGSAMAAGSAEGSGSAMAAGSGSGSAMAAGSGAGSGSAMAAGSGAGSGSGEANEAKGSGFDFDKLSQDEKMEFMKTKVVPVMKKEFQAFDAKRYANFGCKTCHGKDPKKTKYKMPNPELPKLDFAALKAGKQKPKVAEFMGKVVKPKMAEILQQPEYTEQNPKGFGCLECHEQKK